MGGTHDSRLTPERQEPLDDVYIPMWLSGVGFVVAGFLAIMLWRGSK
jgi:hypothetical protein